jgi:hypothetical protein
MSASYVTMQSLRGAGNIFLGIVTAARQPLRLALVPGCVLGLVWLGSVGGWLPRQTPKYNGQDFSETSRFDELPSKSAAGRVAYGKKTTFARTALLGTNGKPPDLKAAVDAANQAHENLPDGSNIWFSPNGSKGVIAAAQLPGSKKTVQFNLSLPQFSQFLGVGKDGQSDKLMDVSAPAMLQRLAQARLPTTTGDDPPAQNPKAKSQHQAEADGGGFGSLSDAMAKVKQEDADKRMGITNQMSDEEKKKARKKYLQEQEWQRQAMEAYPWVSQSDERNAFINKRRNQAAQMQNRIDIARAGGYAESVFVKYRGEVDLTPFECTDVARSSFIDRVCYDRSNEYMLISLNGNFYHYCEIDAGTVSSLLNSPSMGSFYNASIKGAFDCRFHRMPSY